MAKIYKMSNNAKKIGQNPAHIRYINIKGFEHIEKDSKEADNNFSRRKVHFDTVKYKTIKTATINFNGN